MSNLPTKNYFSRVSEAREALKGKSLEVFDLYMKVAQSAYEAQDFETAMKALQYLMSHMPKDGGVSMLDQDIDKPKQVEGGKKSEGIKIGIAIGGMTPQSTPKTLGVAPDTDLKIIDIVSDPTPSET